MRKLLTILTVVFMIATKANSQVDSTSGCANTPFFGQKVKLDVGHRYKVTLDFTNCRAKWRRTKINTNLRFTVNSGGSCGFQESDENGVVTGYFKLYKKVDKSFESPVGEFIREVDKTQFYLYRIN